MHRFEFRQVCASSLTCAACTRCNLDTGIQKSD